METEKSLTNGIGVAGWLLVLVIILTIISPLAMIIDLIRIYESSRQNPYMWLKFSVFFEIISIMTLCTVIFSLYAGISLWRIRPRAVKVTKIYLLCLQAYALIMPFLMGLFSVRSEDMFFAGFVTITLRSLFFVVIWYMYLVRSERVRATFLTV
jgi:hypothetical protein